MLPRIINQRQASLAQGGTTMQLIAPDVLGDLHGLSVPLCAFGAVGGLALWVTGWWAHRFWIVLVTTVAAGTFGLLSAPTERVQPLVASLLLALAAGVLALALVRVVAFAAGGIATWMLLKTFGPAGWDDPLLSILIGGLVGLVMFRLWTMALTSFAGTMLMAYFGLCFADGIGKLDATAFVEGRDVLLNWACGAATVAGIFVQLAVERFRRRRLRDDADPRGAAKYRRPSGGRLWGLGSRSIARVG
jgi:hypothetical protein